MKKITLVIVSIMVTVLSYAQSDSVKQKAYEKAVEAIRLMDNGEIDQSIDLLQESARLDPGNCNYPYEIGLAYYLKEDYKKAVEYYEKVIRMEGASDQAYQMLGLKRQTIFRIF